MTPSLLATDGYKFSMAEAGWPLREETFYYSHRKGGAQVLPLDVAAFVRGLLPRPTEADYRYLAEHEYEMGIGFKSAIQLHDAVRVNSLPRGAVFFDREPAFSVTGPSALVSWLEPLILQINYRIQVATLALTNPEILATEIQRVTCKVQKDIVLETLESLKVKPPQIKVDEDGYFQAVLSTARGLVDIVQNPNRIFEVGMRAATCLEQHEIALRACKEAGITRTSNVLFAQRLGMIPIGTMGHEHVQRYGSDEAAFRAMRDRRPYRSSYLLDTFDTIKSGIPTAFALMRENPDRKDSIRYDSGDKAAQYLYATDLAQKQGLRPIQILEDGFDAALTRHFETLRERVGWKPMEQFYGYGGYLVSKPAPGTLSRDRVAAVWKLSQSGASATMKFGDESGRGKESIPGKPILYRRQGALGPTGIVAQEGESPPTGYVPAVEARLTLPEALAVSDQDRKLSYSPATEALRDRLVKGRPS